MVDLSAFARDYSQYHNNPRLLPSFVSLSAFFVPPYVLRVPGYAALIWYAPSALYFVLTLF